MGAANFGAAYGLVRGMSRWRYPILAWPCAAVLSIASATWAAATDEPGCRDALAALDRHEAQAVAARRAGEASAPMAPGAVRRAQREAAAACLGGAAEDRERRAASPPAAVGSPARSALPPSIGGRPPALLAPVPAVTAAPPVARQPAPSTLSTCDAVGCWTTDGTRLQRAGPGLIGPKGFCSTVGSVVTCP